MDERARRAGTGGADAVSIVLPIPRIDDQVTETIEQYLSSSRDLGVGLEVIAVIPAESGHQRAARHSDIRLVELTDWTWGRAVRRGLSEGGADILAYTNLNRTSPETLALMLAYTVTYRGVVLKANRRTRDSIVQRVGSLLYNAECWKLFDLASWDINGTPKIFPRSCSRLLELSRDDDLIDVEFMLVCQDESYPLLEIPISAIPQRRDWPRTSFREAVRMYTGAYRLWQNRVADTNAS